MGASTRASALLTVALLSCACQAAPPPHPLEPAGQRNPTLGPDGDQAAAGDARQRKGGPGPTTCPRSDGWTLDDPRIAESSGVALSRRHPGVLYTHNDRGNPPSLFAVDGSGTRAVLDLAVPAVDWEDVSTTPDGRIWVADIGDNDGVRASVQVDVAREPDVLVSSAVPSTTYDLRYPDGPHDAEALLVDPRDDRVWVVTKGETGGGTYVAPPRLDADGSNLLKRVGDAPPGISGGDFSPDGGVVVLRNQGRAFFSSGFRSPRTEVELPTQRQGEAVTFTADGRHVLLGSEGGDSRLLCLPVPSDVGR